MKRICAGLFVLLVSTFACARTAPKVADPLRTLTVGGLERSYILHAPASIDPSAPVALILSFHGGTGNAVNQQRVSGFNALADEKGFIVVYPNGTGRLEDKILTWNGGTCCGYAMTHGIDDVAFVRAIVADLQTTYNIDLKRVYATGLSNGGILSYRLACEAADLIAAIAPVSGTLNYKRCQPSEPVSVIHFHGTEDTHLPFDGGYGADSLADVLFASVPESINFWLTFNHCPAAPQTESFADIVHETYSGCANGTSVELYKIIGGKHAWPGSNGPAWPGGDQPTQTISATQLIWEFFVAHPKP